MLTDVFSPWREKNPDVVKLRQLQDFWTNTKVFKVCSSVGAETSHRMTWPEFWDSVRLENLSMVRTPKFTGNNLNLTPIAPGRLRFWGAFGPILVGMRLLHVDEMLNDVCLHILSVLYIRTSTSYLTSYIGHAKFWIANLLLSATSLPETEQSKEPVQVLPWFEGQKTCCLPAAPWETNEIGLSSNVFSYFLSSRGCQRHQSQKHGRCTWSVAPKLCCTMSKHWRPGDKATEEVSFKTE